MIETVSVEIPAEVVRKIPTSKVSEFICQAVDEKLGRAGEQNEWTPKTERGKRMLELRNKFIESGGKLLSREEVLEEVRSRRGGLA
jgi:hypothetical protein